MIKPEYFFWLAVLLSFSLWGNGGGAVSISENAVAAVTEAKASNPFLALSLEAKAVAVYDARLHRVLFEKNADTVLPLASVTKVMTAATALSLVPATTLVTVSADAIKQEGDSGFFVNEEWVLRDLLRFMLLESSNDAAYAVAERVGTAAAPMSVGAAAGRAFFLGVMNKRAASLGLSQTHFENETGLDRNVTTDSAAQAGAVSTAKETALFFANALAHFPDIFTATKWEDLSLPAANGAVRDARNTNHEVGKLPLLLASKTGFTDLAGGNLVVAFDADFGHPIVVIVLGSTETARFSDVEQLVWATLEYLNRH